MKKERIKQNACYWTGFLILCLILYSCLRDESDWDSDTTEIVKGKNRELTLDAAQNWYEANQAPVITTRSVVTNVELMTKLHWKKAFECRQEKFEVVEIPLLAKGGAVLMDKETMEKSSSEEVRGKIRNISRMVIIKNLETGETINFIMHIVGTLDYLMEAKHFEDNSYLYRDPHLSGSVYFYKPEGALVNGWKYENGKIVAEISQGTEEGLQMQATVNTRAYEWKCSYKYVYVEENQCDPFIYQDPEYGLGFGTTCRKTGHYETIQECAYTYVPDEPQEPWMPPTGNDGGNGGGYSSTPEIDKLSEVDKLINNLYANGSSLTTPQLKKLKEVFETIKKSFPIVYEEIKYLATLGVKINFIVDPNSKTDANYSTSHNLRFKTEIDINDVTVREELTHAIQHNEFYKSNMRDPYRMNIELEAKVLCEASEALAGKGFSVATSNLLMGASTSLKGAIQDLMNSIYANRGFTESQLGLYKKVGELVNNEWKIKYPDSNFDSNFSPEALLKYLKPKK